MKKTKRLGLMIPSSDITMEVEFHKYLPKEISLHVTRMPLGEVTPEKLAKMTRESLKSAALLADAEPSLIVYGCTSGSFIGGKGYDEKLEKRIRAHVGIPVITTAHAVIELLKDLSLDPIVICTPYTDEINLTERSFLEAHGFHVTKIHGMGIVKDIEIGKLDTEFIYEFVKRNDDPKAKIMFISCTNLKTLDIIPSLRAEIRKPVISSNLATLWAACKRLGVKTRSVVFDGLP